MMSVEYNLCELLWKLQVIDDEQFQWAQMHGAHIWDDQEWCARGCP